MRFSEQWLREWVNPDVSTDELVEQLTMAGLEVDTVEPAAPAFEKVLVAEVLEVGPHPDADKLRVCKVSVGEGDPLQIVCGAPNVRAGMKAPLACVGGVMPGDFKIKKAKLRGVESFGMLCSARELGLSEDHGGLMDLPADAPVGEDLRDYLQLNDQLIDIDLTPNRGDCLGIAGVAREVGVLTRSAVTDQQCNAIPAAHADTFPVTVEAAVACPRYLGRVIRGIDPGAQTPLWMRERLRRCGVRSLGPVVDVTNYVLLELGQPMHAFDLATLDGGIKVRYASAGEKLVLLDGNEVEMDPETLVIADHAKPLALAGVMGGEHSGVGTETKDLFLECAFFDPKVIAGRARRYGLVTDSSFRFERGVDPELQHRAMERATALLLDLVGGEAGPITECLSESHLPEREPILLRAERIRRLLGLAPSDEEVSDILNRLGMETDKLAEGWKVNPPSFRFDITIEADLIEEIGRVYGYNRLPSTRPSARMDMAPAPEARVALNRVQDLLVQRDYQEAITYSFVDPKLQQKLDPERPGIALSNPISSEMSVMRTSLWPGLIQALQHNLNRQQGRVRLFECGLRFLPEGEQTRQENMLAMVATGTRYPEQWAERDDQYDFFDLKADVQALLALGGRAGEFSFAVAAHPALHPGRSAEIFRNGKSVGYVGCLHPRLCGELDIPLNTYACELLLGSIIEGGLAHFQEISKYPSIRRDLALVVDAGLAVQDLEQEIHAAAGPHLQNMVVFDVYQGERIENGRKSIALGLILQDSSRTLTDEDVNAVINTVTDRLENRFRAQLRE